MKIANIRSIPQQKEIRVCKEYIWAAPWGVSVVLYEFQQCGCKGDCDF